MYISGKTFTRSQCFRPSEHFFKGFTKIPEATKHLEEFKYLIYVTTLE